jgi:hypothetical protein
VKEAGLNGIGGSRLFQARDGKPDRTQSQPVRIVVVGFYRAGIEFESL